MKREKSKRGACREGDLTYPQIHADRRVALNCCERIGEYMRAQRTSLGLTLIQIRADRQCQNKLAVETLFRLTLQLKTEQWADSKEGICHGGIVSVICGLF